MKRQLSALLAALTLTVSGANAMYFTSGQFNYSTDSEPQRCTLTGVAVYLEGDIEIPSIVSYIDEEENPTDYTVVSIGDEAFQYQEDVTSFTLPSTIETIGNNVFSGCWQLTNLVFPDATTSIGEMVLDGCSGIKTITLGSQLESIGYMAFEGASDLEKVIITATVPPTLDGEDTFNWQVLSSMTLEVPAGCAEAYRNAPYWSDIANIVEAQPVIPESLIADNVIYSDFSAEEPFTCMAIGLDPDASALNIVVHGKIEVAGRTYTVIGISDNAFSNASIGTLSIEEGVQSIGENAFKLCAELKNITLPSSLQSIGQYAFWGCKGISELQLPDGITTIPDYTFAYCGGLTSLTLPAQLNSIGFKSFYQCKALDGLVLPNSLNSIGNEAFEECKGISQITIPESVTSLGNLAFYQCESLSDIVINAAITEIPESCFAYSGVTNITFPSTLDVIGKNAFEQCNELVSIEIPSSVTKISNDAFTNCILLTTVSGMENITEIGNYAFYECEALTNFSFSESLETLGNGIFMRCYALNEVNIPSGSLGENVFLGCSGIKSVTFGGQVTKIGADAFRDCDAIETVTTEAATPPALANDAFTASVFSDAQLVVPADYADAYAEAEGWKKFNNISSGIKALTSTELPFLINGNDIVILTDSNIAIYTIDGKTILSGSGMADRKVTLREGEVYIVRYEGRSLKVNL